jgi:hypothetical protein
MDIVGCMIHKDAASTVLVFDCFLASGCEETSLL